MHVCEPRVTADRRTFWISAFAVALWLFLVNPGTAIAGGEHQSSGRGSPSDHEAVTGSTGRKGVRPLGVTTTGSLRRRDPARSAL